MVATMVDIPVDVMAVFNDPNAVKIIGTKSPEGSLHVIRVGSMSAPAPNMVIIGAILMKRTSKNLEAMKPKGELVSLNVSKEMKSFEIKAAVKDYLTSGPIFDKMNERLKPMGLTARGVWVFEPKEVWNQSPSYEAGTKMV
jgi:hypothetical protein